MIGILAGQVSKSLIIDHYGLLGTPHRKVDRKRVVALIFIVATCTCGKSVGDSHDNFNDFFAVIGGALLSVQAAINGQLGAKVGVFRSAF